MRARFRDLVVVENPTDTAPAVDDYGDVDEAEGGTWTATEVVGLLWQTTSVEQNLDRETVATLWMLHLPPEADIRSSSRVTITYLDDERVLRVLGEPTLRSTMRGPHHYEVTLEEVKG